MTQDMRICFLGDSLVNGTGDETALGWAGRLCAHANAGGAAITYYNLGIRRETSRDVQRRWQQECALRLSSVIDGRIVLSCGVNDTVMEGGATRLNLRESCASVREILKHAAAKYKTIMVGPLPVGDDAHNARISAISAAFARAARALAVPYIEVYSPLVGDAQYRREIAAGDGAHPRGAGYARVADIIRASRDWWFR